MSALRPFLVALTFLTRAPVRLGSVTEADLGRSVAWFPAVGLVIGLGLAGIAWLGRGWMAAEPCAVVLVAAQALATGGLHIDGLADVFDGLGGGRGDRARTLDIMRDSRIGALGATAVVLALLGKVVALAGLLRADTTWPLPLFPAAARWATTPLVILFPYARKEGLGRPFHEGGRASRLVIATLTLGIPVVALGWRALLPVGAAAVAAAIIAISVLRRLGGLTGDVYGAAIELGEVAFLLAARPGS